MCGGSIFPIRLVLLAGGGGGRHHFAVGANAAGIDVDKWTGKSWPIIISPTLSRKLCLIIASSSDPEAPGEAVAQLVDFVERQAMGVSKFGERSFPPLKKGFRGPDMGGSISMLDGPSMLDGIAKLQRF